MPYRGQQFIQRVFFFADMSTVRIRHQGPTKGTAIVPETKGAVADIENIPNVKSGSVLEAAEIALISNGVFGNTGRHAVVEVEDSTGKLPARPRPRPRPARIGASCTEIFPAGCSDVATAAAATETEPSVLT